MSKVLYTGKNLITQTYESHLDKHNTGRGWAVGVDVVKHPGAIDKVCANTYGVVIKTMTGQVNGKDDPEGMGYGNYVMISHGDNIVTLYAHLASVCVIKGQTVNAGEVIGEMGNTGKSYGAHLHFEERAYHNDPLFVKNLHDLSNFRWLNPTVALEEEIKITKPSYSDYSASSIPNRFKVMLGDIQKGAFTMYKLATNMADDFAGTVVDSVTGEVIYISKKYNNNTIPNRFKVMKDGKQINAYKSYTFANIFSKLRNAEIYDSVTQMYI